MKPSSGMKNSVSVWPVGFFRHWLFLPSLLSGLVHLLFYRATSPGIVTNDSLWQYAQGKNQSFDDMHPPVMAYLWNVLETVLGSPSVLLGFHLLLSFSAGLIFFRRYRSGIWPYVVLFLPLLPWVGNYLGVLWKDVLMANLLLLAVSLMTRRVSRIAFFVFLVLISLAWVTRHNAFFAVVPILLIAVGLWVPRQRILAGLAGGFAILLSVGFYNVYLPTGAPQHGGNQIFVDDLSAISIARGETLLPNVSLSDIVACEGERVFGMNSTGYIRCLGGWHPNDDGTWLRERSLFRPWISTVATNPSPYLAYRLSVFWEFLRLGDSPHYVLAGTHQGDEQGLGFTPNVLWKTYEDYVRLVLHYAPSVFLPFYWYLASLSITGFASVQLLRKWREPVKEPLSTDPPRSEIVHLALGSSAFLYISSYFLAVTGADFRFVYWSVVATTYSIAILIFGSIKKPWDRKSVAG